MGVTWLSKDRQRLSTTPRTFILSATGRSTPTTDTHDIGRGDLQLTGCLDDKSLRLIRIELQAVLQVPLPDVSSTGGEDSQTIGGVVGVYGQFKLCVVGVQVEVAFKL